MVVQFKKWICDLTYGRYRDQSIAIRLRNVVTHEPIAKATVCLVTYGKKPEPLNVFIKDYSENEGMVDALAKAGVILPEPVRVIDLHYVKVGEFMLSDECINEIKSKI
jgi:hypothetical protein